MEQKESTRKIDHGISLIEVDSAQEGLNRARNILYKLTGERRNNLLFLSGGATPGPLYKKLAEENGLGVAKYLMIDERYGREMHEDSNQRVIVEAGLGNKGFHPILDDDVVGLEQTAQAYDRYFASLVSRKKDFGKWIAVMGVGADGHTAGLPAGAQISPIRQAQGDTESIEVSNLKSQNYVESIGNFTGEFKERITLTLRALAEMDVLLILAFGREKKDALLKMLTEGSLEEIPARFYAKPEIAKKTILITDQKGLE